jgi:ribosomal protein S12 methylthiotransferase
VRGRYWLETLGCPKNQVDSDKLEGTLVADGYVPATSPAAADIIVVNTCAFIEDARRESVEVALELSSVRKERAQLVVTGCMAERYGAELADALPEADLVAGVGVPVTLVRKRAGDDVDAVGTRHGRVPLLDLLNLPRPRSQRPWAYVKVAEGCNRSCGYCAIPSFRGPQRSRPLDSVLAEVDALDVQEAVLVAQDLASYGRDIGRPAIIDLVSAVTARVRRVRLLYLYPSDLSDALIDAIEATGVHYFDLSLQHVSRRHLRRMRRWGDGERFLARIDAIRARMPDAAFRSNFIIGYPGETEADHDALLEFVGAAQLDWCGMFAFSREEGTYAAGLPDSVPDGLVAERLAEAIEVQERVTDARRAALVGTTVEVLVDEPGVARSHREAPEIDGIIAVPDDLTPGTFAWVEVTGAEGPDLEGRPVTAVVRR